LVVARRIRETTPPGSVLVSENTYRLVQSLFKWASPEEIAIEGVSEPSTAYCPLAHRVLPGKERGIAGISSPLVGRQPELHALQDAVTRLQEGMGGIVTLVGEAGMGKSRLVAEVRRQTRAQDPKRVRYLRPAVSLQWVEGRCLSYRTSIAYHLWLDMLRELLGTAPDASPTDVCDVLSVQVRALCPQGFDAVYPQLARLMSLPLKPDQAAALHGLDAESLKAVTFRAVEMLVESMARQCPLLVVCEDLQWADYTSIALLEHLMPLTDRVPLLLVCVFRPERAGGCWRIKEAAARLYPHRHIDLWLAPLSGADSEELAGNLLRRDVGRASRIASQPCSRETPGGIRGESVKGLPHLLQVHVLARAEGNPFYIEEIVRSLMDSGIIVYDEIQGRWTAVGDVAEVAVPDTLNGTLMSRIDRLPEAARQVLQLASVVGRIFTDRVLAAIAEGAFLFSQAGELVVAHRPGNWASTLDDCLAVLQREQMIRERARIPEREFIFKHQLTLEAVYHTLLTRDRCYYHRVAAEVIERLHPDRVEERLGLLAYHWEQAGETEQAITYLRRAGEYAAAQFANEEAESYFTRALDLTPEENVAERSAFLQAREEMYDLLGEREAQREDLVLLEQLAEALGDSEQQARVALRQAHYAIRTNDYPAAAATAQVAIRIAQAAQDVASEAAGFREWGRALFYRQEYGLAQEKLDRALVLARRAGLRSIETDCLQNLGAIFLNLSDHATASTHFKEKLNISREMGDRASEGVALRGLGVAAGDAGEYAKARAYLEQSLRVCRETGNRRDEGWAFLSLGDLSWAVGDYDRARTYHEQCLEVCRATRDRSGKGRSLLVLGDVSRIQGDYAGARACFGQSLKISREVGVPIIAGFALMGLGLVSYDLGDLVGAKSYLEQAVAVRRESRHSIVDPLSQLAHVHLSQGDLPQALMCVEEVLHHLDSDPALSRSREAPAAYLACYRVLRAQGDPRAGRVLSAAHRSLQECATKIHDEGLRRSFLENVVAHSEILAAWEEEKPSDHPATAGYPDSG
jgi:predicted ATPase